jgi:glycerol dehydrogenase
VIGVGGGKALDAAKAAANKRALPIICIPTIASTCSAASPASVLYDSQGGFLKSLYFPNTPELVLVEPSVIAKAPLDYFTAGILDALSKWYELKSVFSTIKSPDLSTRSAMELSRFLRDVVHQKGASSVEAVHRGTTTSAVEEIIDVNIHLTAVIKCLSLFTLAIGLAHAIHNGLSFLRQTHDKAHGVKVGYGIAVQLCVEGTSENELLDVFKLFRQIGFNPSLRNLGISATTRTKQKIVANCIDDIGVKSMPMSITEEMILDGIDRVEEYAKRVDLQVGE